jgi:hypothetical protein
MDKIIINYSNIVVKQKKYIYLCLLILIVGVSLIFFKELSILGFALINVGIGFILILNVRNSSNRAKCDNCETVLY